MDQENPMESSQQVKCKALSEKQLPAQSTASDSQKVMKRKPIRKNKNKAKSKDIQKRPVF